MSKSGAGSVLVGTGLEAPATAALDVRAATSAGITAVFDGLSAPPATVARGADEPKPGRRSCETGPVTGRVTDGVTASRTDRAVPWRPEPPAPVKTATPG